MLTEDELPRALRCEFAELQGYNRVVSDSPRESVPVTGEPLLTWRFRIVHVVYVVTLLASALATFGVLGIIPAVFIGGLWAAVFISRSRPRSFGFACVIGLCLVALCVPAMSPSREAARRMWCSDNLKKIGLALLSYHQQHGSFPPAYLVDADGRPQHSWRVLILPFLNEQQLYDEYEFDEPWDGPNNRRLLDKMPYVYACPSDDHGRNGGAMRTSYVAVVGPATMWPGRSPVAVNEIKDGAAGTALVIEYSDLSIPWLQPADLEFDQALQRLAPDAFEPAWGHEFDHFFCRTFFGRHVATADGSIHFCPHGASTANWSALLQRDDRAGWDGEGVEGPATFPKRLNVGNCLRFAFFLGLVVLPLPWVWLNPTSSVQRREG